jgi:hypothetical protein
MQTSNKVKVSDWMTEDQRKEFKTLVGRYTGGFKRFTMSDGTKAGKISYTFEGGMLSEIEVENPDVDPAKLVSEIVELYRKDKAERSERAKRAAQTRKVNAAHDKIQGTIQELWKAFKAAEDQPRFDESMRFCFEYVSELESLLKKYSDITKTGRGQA